MTIGINGMAHVILTVSRFEVAREFYRKLLPEFGMKPVFDGYGFFYCVGARTAGRQSGAGRRADAKAALVRAARGGRRRTVAPAADRIATQLGCRRFRASRDDGGPRRAGPGNLCRRADVETRAIRQSVSRLFQWPSGGSRASARRPADRIFSVDARRTACARRMVAGSASQMPRKRTLPSRTTSLIAPIVSSIGTVGSILWM